MSTTYCDLLAEAPFTALSLGYAVCETEHVTWRHKYTALTQCPARGGRVYIYIREYRAVVSCEVTETRLSTPVLEEHILQQHKMVAFQMSGKERLVIHSNQSGNCRILCGSLQE